MESAVTLVHKNAMPIAIHALNSFARHYSETHKIFIHTDGSLDGWDHEVLLTSARKADAVIVTPKDRLAVVTRELAKYPKTLELISRRGYFTKLELPIFHPSPYFYFDSDVVMLQPVSNLAPPDGRSAFSTEAWSWYFGIRNDSAWVNERTPRRVNSGFYYLNEAFPFERMESLLERNMYDPEINGSSDQEIMAYLYPEMLLYHPEDIKRSRVGKTYDLPSLEAAALHFPGRMYQTHMDQIEKLVDAPTTPSRSVRFVEPVPLVKIELIKMRAFMFLANSELARGPIKLLRKLRGFLTRA